MPLLLDSLLKFIAPHQCLACGRDGSLLCEVCLPLLPDVPACCCRCGAASPSWQTCRRCRSTSALQFAATRTPYEAFSKALLHALKFEYAIAAAQAAASSMAELRLQVPEGSVLVPVPTATSRVRQRGYDQAAVIARQLSKQWHIPSVPLLLRHGQTRQTGSTRAERIRQLADAFEVRTRQSRNIQSVVLVDDVLTTGATLEVAAKTLRKAGVKYVGAVTFARAE